MHYFKMTSALFTKIPYNDLMYVLPIQENVTINLDNTDYSCKSMMLCNLCEASTGKWKTLLIYLKKKYILRNGSKCKYFKILSF